jgi:site-specific DNA-cytosine methylase
LKVVSLFDGMGCGYQALKQAGVSVTEYHAFEIDEAAMAVAHKNHPDIIHHGDVEGADFTCFAGADLLIAGSPCQGFSFAGKQLAFEDPRSKLFFEFVRAKKEISPHNFLLENVKMKKEYLAIISQFMGVQPVNINSSLLSAQSRNRYYWTNIPFSMPEDRGIHFGDVVQSGGEPNGSTWHAWWARRGEYQLRKSFSKVLGLDDKALCLVARMVANWNGNLVSMGGSQFRYITPLEAERLQTLPDGYTAGVPDSARYKMIGNGWTVAVIQHIFDGL